MDQNLYLASPLLVAIHSIAHFVLYYENAVIFVQNHVQNASPGQTLRSETVVSKGLGNRSVDASCQYAIQGSFS